MYFQQLFYYISIWYINSLKTHETGPQFAITSKEHELARSWKLRWKFNTESVLHTSGGA